MRLPSFLPLLLFAAPLAALDWSTHGPLGGSVAQVAISPAAPQVIYAGNGAGVFRSDDAGATWRDVSGPLHAIAAPPEAPDSTEPTPALSMNPGRL